MLSFEIKDSLRTQHRAIANVPKFGGDFENFTDGFYFV